jgi:hypothetical protein
VILCYVLIWGNCWTVNAGGFMGVVWGCPPLVVVLSLSARLSVRSHALNFCLCCAFALSARLLLGFDRLTRLQAFFKPFTVKPSAVALPLWAFSRSRSSQGDALGKYDWYFLPYPLPIVHAGAYVRCYVMFPISKKYIAILTISYIKKLFSNTWY